MRIGVLMGLTDEGWVPVADPSVELHEQKALLKTALTAGGVIDGVAYRQLACFTGAERVIRFDKPAVEKAGDPGEQQAEKPAKKNGKRK